MEFRLLGPFEVRRNGVRLALGGPRQRTVLAALVLRCNEVVSVDQLTEAVWEQAPASPASNIRTYVRGLRTVLSSCGEDASRLVTRSPGYVLATKPGEVDWQVFEEFAELGSVAMANTDHPEALRCFQRALGLWRGQPFDGLEVGPQLRSEATRLQERRLAVVEQRALARMSVGQNLEAISELRRELAAHPLREVLWARLMLALYRTGHQAEALTAYQDVRRLLLDELGIEPCQELRELHQSIVTSDPALQGSLGVRATHQLPMDIAEFTGRTAQLDRLHQLVRAAPGKTGTAVVISTINGMAGVGKTRLAVRAAHQITASARFDEIQLYADLQGFAADRAPTAPATVLASFLHLLGVPGGQIPRDLDERATLYRDRLHGKRALLLLDNAATEDQVRPLLPGSPTSLVLITSRRRLSGLDGAQPLALDVFTVEESLALLSRIAGAERLAADPVSATRIAELCGHLPIALTLAGRRLQTRPTWTLADLAGRLEAADRRLGQLAAGTRAVRTTFDLSYQALPADQQRIFRLLALHPGEDASASSAAALVEVSPAEAESLLEALLDEHLLIQTAPGRYRFHDLLRAYALERVDSDETPDDRHAALGRVLGWYLHATDAADRMLDTRRRHVTPDPRYAQQHLPTFDGYPAAAAWFEAEYANAVAAVHAAAAAGLDVIAWQLPAALLNFFYLRSHRDDWIATHEVALAATQRLGDRKAEAATLNRLGMVYDLDQLDKAVDCCRRALAIQREIGDRSGEAWTLNNLGVAYTDLHRYPDALDCFEPALEVFRETGDRRGEGLSLGNLGDTYRKLNRWSEAVHHLNEALALNEEIDDQAGRRYTLYGLGDLHQDLGQYDQALSHYREALDIDQALGDQWGRAWVLNRIGLTLKVIGQLDEARECWQEALAIFTELGDSRVAEVTERLDGLS